MKWQWLHNAWLMMVSGATLSIAGCGSAESLPPLTPIKGKVTLDDQSMVGVTLVFNPLNGTAGTGAYGVTNENGEYTLKHQSEREGIQPGQYGVTFSKITQPDGSPIPPNANRAEIGMVEQMPKVYTVFSPEAVVELAKVETTPATIDFKLNSKRKAPFGLRLDGPAGPGGAGPAMAKSRP